jgi:Flp pilus assembly protein TadD
VTTIAMLLASIAISAAPDPCAVNAGDNGQSRAVPDTKAAAEYREVGDEESAGGNVAAATFAYREALRRSPHDPRTRAALALLCADERHLRARAQGANAVNRHFDRGLRLMESGDRTGAVTAFELVRSSESDPSAALLEGICELELGNHQHARVLLLEAKAEPEIEGTAVFFLGLLAFRDGDVANASSLFTSAGAIDSRLSASVSDVLRLARREGRLILSAVSEVGVDSNVELTPDGTAAGSGSADVHGIQAIGIVGRPFGVSGPYLRANAQYRQQLRLTSYDLASVAAAIGARANRDGHYFVAAEYAYDFLALGQSPFLSAHRLLVAGRLPRDSLAISGTYYARFETFLAPGTSGYSGLRHDLTTEAEWRPGQRASLLVGYHVGRDGAQDPALGYLEHGPFAGFRVDGGGRIRVAIESHFTQRRYAAADIDLDVQRDERYFDGSAVVDLDISEHWAFRIAGTGRRALSNVAALQYTKLTGSLGLLYAAGVL